MKIRMQSVTCILLVIWFVFDLTQKYEVYRVDKAHEGLGASAPPSIYTNGQKKGYRIVYHISL